MHSQNKHAFCDEPWRHQRFARELLPMTEERDRRGLVSDTIKLRIATALQSSLHVRDIIKGFTGEVQRMVEGVRVRYRHSGHKVVVDDWRPQLHHYTYELTLVGKYLGEITFSRGEPLHNDQLELLEVLLCTLVYPLRNALQYERALKIALKDPLTGVSNRATMTGHLSHHMSLAERQHTALSVLMIDIDFFKSINDRFGHIVGDIVLTQVANRIVGCIRTSDGVFRYGGEEFAVVLPGTDARGAELLAERIRSEIEAMVMDSVPAAATVTVSIGVASHVAGESQVHLLQRADDLLLAAKRAGRNRVMAAGLSQQPQLSSA